MTAVQEDLGGIASQTAPVLPESEAPPQPGPSASGLDLALVAWWLGRRDVLGPSEESATAGGEPPAGSTTGARRSKGLKEAPGACTGEQGVDKWGEKPGTLSDGAGVGCGGVAGIQIGDVAKKLNQEGVER